MNYIKGYDSWKLRTPEEEYPGEESEEDRAERERIEEMEADSRREEGR